VSISFAIFLNQSNVIFDVIAIVPPPEGRVNGAPENSSSQSKLSDVSVT
jgi:hypothetical protein